MFKVFILVIAAALGGPQIVQSNSTFDTMEACEAARTGDETVPYSVKRFEKYLKDQGVDGQVAGSKCDQEGSLEQSQRDQELKTKGFYADAFGERIYGI